MESESTGKEEGKQVVTFQPKFKAGDKVIVTHQTTKQEDLPMSYWPDKKLASIGRVGTILRHRHRDNPKDMGICIGNRECYTVRMDDNTLHDHLEGLWTFQVQGLKKATKWQSKKLEKKPNRK